MTDPAGALAARIERFEQAADPGLIWDPAALSEAEQAMRDCAGDRSDAAAWRLIAMLHLARYRLDEHTVQDAAVAGAFFAAVAVLDPDRLPERLRGPHAPPAASADTWAGLVAEVLRQVDPAAYRHVGLLVHALVRRAVADPAPEVCERLAGLLLQESARSADPSWASGALGPVGAALVRLHGASGERGVIDDAVHLLLRAALGDAAYAPDLAAALGPAAGDDDELVRAYLAAAEAPAGGQDRSRALLTLVELAQARAAATCADGDLLAFIRLGQCALDFWHEQWAHPGVLAPYASGLVEWYVVTGDERSLEAGVEMLETLRVPPDESMRGLGTDPAVRLGLLGERRLRRHLVTGDLADLDEAVHVLREAAGHAPDGHPGRAGHLTVLAGALHRRAVVTDGDPAEAVAAARAALAALGEQDPARPGTLLLLGRTLKLGLTPGTAGEAVAALREALAAGGRASLRVEAYGLVSEVLRWRATHAGGRRADDLREAVLAARQGAELAQRASYGQAGARRTLCEALLARYTALRDPLDLTEALSLAGDGDAALLSGLDAPPEVDDQLAPAATELALRLPDADQEVALELLALAERGAAEPGEFLLEVAQRLTAAGRERVAVLVLDRAARAFASDGANGADGALARGAYALERQGAAHESLASQTDTAHHAIDDHTPGDHGSEHHGSGYHGSGYHGSERHDSERPGSEHPGLVPGGEFGKALSAYERAAAIHRSLADPRSEARQLRNMGLVHLRIGDPARAVERHLRAAALCEAAGLPVEEAAHQGDAAEACLTMGDPAAAVACAVRARELHLESGDVRAAALALVPAARAAVDQDDLTAAGERMAACAIELEAAGEWEEACRTLDAHAVTLAGCGHHGRAAACEMRLVEIARRRGRRREPADEWYRIGRRRRVRGDTEGARVAFELAGREYEAIGHHDGAASVRYNLGVLTYAEGEPGAALEAFGAAAEAFAGLRAPVKEAFALVMGAACLTALDRVEDALPDLDRALELAAAEGDPDALLAATLVRAAADVRLGEPREAKARLRAVLGPVAGDALKEAVVHDRLAAIAAREGDPRAQAEAQEAALAGFRASGQDRLAALASIKLGLALEANGAARRARARLEEGLDGLATAPDPRPSGTPFEIVAAMAGGLDAVLLSRLAAIQLTIGDVTAGRVTLAQAVTSLRAESRPGQALDHLERRLRLEEAESTGDLATARTLAEQALNATPPDATPPGAGASGRSRADGGVPDRAASGGHAFGRTTAEGADDRSYLLAKLSLLCRELGDPAAAHAYAARGYELRDERAAEHLSNLGAAATALGRVEEAAEHLTRAVELARDDDAALPARLVRSLGLLGAALTDQGRWQEAARAYEEGLALAEAPAWRALRAPLLSGRAALHLKLGELDEAATRYREAITIIEQPRPHTRPATPHPAPPPAARPETSNLTPPPARPPETLNTAPPHPGRPASLGAASGPGLAVAYAGLALVHELGGRPAEAVPLLERALDLERAHGRGRGTVLTLIALARLEPAPRQPDGAAVTRLEEALVLAREIGFRAGEAIALRHLGAHDLTAASRDLARHRLSTAIDLLSELGHDHELALACHHRSIAAEELGDLPAALADAERACALGHEAARDRAFRLAVRLNLGMTAWTHAEQAKLNALTAWLTPRPEAPAPEAPAPEASTPDDPSLPDRGQDLTDTARTLMTAARNTRDPEQAALLTHRARTTLDHLRRRPLDEPTPQGLPAPRSIRPPTRAELDALVSVPGHEGATGARALLGFHLDESTVTVLAHRTGWPEPRAFPTAVGPVLLDGFRRTVHGHRPGLLDIEARRHRADLWSRLADLLLAAATDALGDGIDLLHLLPSPELRQIPLHALAPSGRPLLARFPVTYAPSAAVLSRLRSRPRTPGGGSLVLGWAADPAARPPAEAEAHDVAALLGTRPHTDGEAVSSLLPGVRDVLHLACPAVYDHADPFGSGLRLPDGVLTARRLMTMNVTAGLALITAHEPAPPPVAPAGDGLAALSYALLRAGVRSALLTLWPVSAEVTRALARDVHTRLRAGVGPARAVRAAVLGLRELYGSTEPDLWASFVPVGLGDDAPVHGDPGMSVTSAR